MITQEQKRLLLENMTGLLELPESAYEKAAQRYDDLGEWFDRKDSLVKDNKPHILPQGSFRLGTAIRPLDEKEAYDLDLVCKLRDGITKRSHTQEALKNLVGHELELYRIKRGIKAPKEEKHRCWRLEYQDDLNFHMDIVPCIPADESKRKLILESMRKSGIEESVAGSVSQLTVSITDDRRLPAYVQITDDWLISNPEGYAKWFEYRMNPSQMIVLLEKAQVDDVPIFKHKSPLQRSIQLLKRHRDQMFGKDESKPISIIITTLATRAYNGEQDIESALTSILSKMGDLVYPVKPRVPNPVDPGEDFADRWTMPQYRDLKLEDNFFLWLSSAKSDFAYLMSTDDMTFIAEKTMEKFAVKLDESALRAKLGITAMATRYTPKEHVIQGSSKPWRA
jgi:hypothetical protein